MEQLRRRRKAGWEISQETGIPLSMVSKHLKAIGLGRIWKLDEEQDPPRRYEHAAPGGMFHIDAKKLACIHGVGQHPWRSEPQETRCGLRGGLRLRR
jgi:hypothetical protein